MKTSRNMDYRITPPDEIIETKVSLPLSKSISARTLIINALTPGGTLPGPMADCDDTAALTAALADPAATHINVGAAGTAMRFLTAYMAVQQGRTVTLDGSERMRRRPIGALVDALRRLGAEIACEGEEGFPPLRITGRALSGGELEVDASVSSQFISALLMIAPCLKGGLKLTLKGSLVSRPYIVMTLGLMEKAGVESDFFMNTITVPERCYTPTLPPVEPDWSAASAWYEIAAISSGWVTFDRLPELSLQGDRETASLYADLGVATDFEGEEGTELSATPDQLPRLVHDFTDTPDIAQGAVVACAMLGIPFRFTGLRTLAVKETDRRKALVAELAKTGVLVGMPDDDTLTWEGERAPIGQLPVFDTYDDHRMAMALAPVALFMPGITVRNAEVVSKSYPDYWEHLRAAGFTLEEVEPQTAE